MSSVCRVPGPCRRSTVYRSPFGSSRYFQKCRSTTCLPRARNPVGLVSSSLGPLSRPQPPTSVRHPFLQDPGRPSCSHGRMSRVPWWPGNDCRLGTESTRDEGPTRTNTLVPFSGGRSTQRRTLVTETISEVDAEYPVYMTLEGPRRVRGRSERTLE